MSHTLNEEHIYCPYCGERLSVLIDSQDAAQEYIEDCQVCCRPIQFKMTTAFNGEIHLEVSHENE